MIANVEVRATSQYQALPLHECINSAQSADYRPLFVQAGSPKSGHSQDTRLSGLKKVPVDPGKQPKIATREPAINSISLHSTHTYLTMSVALIAWLLLVQTSAHGRAPTL